MREKDTITVYWAPSLFDPDKESWSMMYPEPYPLKKDLNDKAELGAGIKICPAVKDGINNVFVLSTAIDDDFEIPIDIIKEMVEGEQFDKFIPIDGANLGLRLSRPPEYVDSYNYTYNLGWMFFADEPVDMRFTSPWFPPSSPLEGASLPPGQFDIGRWYRSINLEYVTPQDSTRFSLKAGDAIAYLEFMTDKKIIFKRYVSSDRLTALSKEFSSSSARFGFYKKLSERYTIAKRSKMTELVLAEIKKNLVE
jgi:hypothetical protein